MAKCKFCGAEVTIGERCTYCGSKAEGWYYSGEEKVEVNRYFKEGEKSFIEISPEEYEERKKMHEKRQEQEDKAQDEN